MLSAGSAAAHEVRPAYLALRETAPDRFDVRFKGPTRGDRVLRPAPVLPDACAAGGQRSRERGPGAGGTRSAVPCPEGIKAVSLCNTCTCAGSTPNSRLTSWAKEVSVPWPWGDKPV